MHPEDTASCHPQFPVMAGMSWSNSGTARFKLDRDCATMAGPNTHYNERSWTKRELDDREGIHRKNFCGEPRVDHFQPKVLAGIRIESPGAAVSTKKEHIFFLCLKLYFHKHRSMCSQCVELGMAFHCAT